MQRTYYGEFATIIPAIALTLKPLEDAPHRKAGDETGTPERGQANKTPILYTIRLTLWGGLFNEENIIIIKPL